MEDKEVVGDFNNKNHYTSDSGLQVIDVIEAFDLHKNAYLFNVVKYILRAGKKQTSSTIIDITKAKNYLDRYLKMLEDKIW